MKKMAFFLIMICNCITSLILMNSCANNNQKKLIESSVSTSWEGVKSDLNFKMIRLENKTAITKTDGIVFLIFEFMPIESKWIGDTIKAKCQNKEGNLGSYSIAESDLDRHLKLLNQIDESCLKIIKIEEDEVERLQKDTILDPLETKDLDYIKSLKLVIADAKYEKYKTGKKIKNVELAKKYFQSPSETVVLRAFDCTYSLFNAALQIDETLTKRFYFNDELTEIIGYQTIQSSNNDIDDQNKATEKYFELRIVNVWQDHGVGKIKFEIKNKQNKRIDDLYFEVSLIDSNGEYFGDTESVRFNNVRPNGIGVTDEGWRDINIDRIKEIIIVPERLVLEGQEYQFNSNYLETFDNKFSVKINL